MGCYNGMAGLGKYFAQMRYVLARVQARLELSSIRDSTIAEGARIGSGTIFISSSMGRHSYCGTRCAFRVCDVGSFCSIADDVYVGGSKHPLHFVSTSPVFLSHRDSVKKKYARLDYYSLPRTTIGNDVWIGYGAVIKSGVNIGHGAVIGMGSIVTRDVRDYAIVAGNPAREIRRRFSDDIVEALLKTKWWDLDDKRLSEVGGLFDNPVQFLIKEGRL